MAKKRLGNNPLGHLVSSRPTTPPKEERGEEVPQKSAAETSGPAVSDADFKRNTVHMRTDYVRLMKRIAALEGRDIKDVYDEAIGAYIETKQDLIDRHDL